jgi:hypothetical protein
VERKEIIFDRKMVTHSFTADMAPLLDTLLDIEHQAIIDFFSNNHVFHPERNAPVIFDEKLVEYLKQSIEFPAIKVKDPNQEELKHEKYASRLAQYFSRHKRHDEEMEKSRSESENKNKRGITISQVFVCFSEYMEEFRNERVQQRDAYRSLLTSIISFLDSGSANYTFKYDNSSNRSCATLCVGEGSFRTGIYYQYPFNYFFQQSKKMQYPRMEALYKMLVIRMFEKNSLEFNGDMLYQAIDFNIDNEDIVTREWCRKYIDEVAPLHVDGISAKVLQNVLDLGDLVIEYALMNLEINETDCIAFANSNGYEQLALEIGE